MGDDAAEFAFELADRVIDKGFDHLPTKWFGVATPKTSKRLQSGKGDDRYGGHSSDGDDDYDRRSRRKQSNDYDSRDNRDPYSPSSRSAVNRPRGGELPLSSRSDRYGYDDRNQDSYSPYSQRSSKTSRREPTSASESRPRPHRYRSDRAYDSDDDQSRSKKKPNPRVIALGAVAGALVIGAIGSSALKKRRTRKQEEEEVWDKKYGRDNGSNTDHEASDDDVHGSSRRRRNNNGGSQQSLPLRGGEDRSYGGRSMGGR